MVKSKITMVCKETSRAVVYIEHYEDESLEVIKDRAWTQFDAYMSKDLEQDNFTKVERA